MAQGTITLFQNFSKTISGTIALGADTFYLALTSTVPTAGDAVPTWGAGGTTNESSNEVSAGGGYTANGVALTSVTWTQSSGTATWDAADPSWTSSGSGDPTNIKTGIFYSNTATNKDCVGFMDMTADGGTTAISLLSGDINVTLNASGILTLA